MRLRRIGLAAAAVVAATVGVMGPAVAAPPTYPPAAGGAVQVIVPGLTLGGSSARAVPVTLSPSDPSDSITLGRGARLIVTLTGFDAGEAVSGAVEADCTGNDFSGSFGPYTAGDEGITIGPFQFARPCVYTFTFTSEGMTTSLGVGGKVPAAAVAAVAGETYTLRVTITDEAAAGAGAVSQSALPQTGGSGLTPLWIGLGLVVLGGGAYALSRRRGAPVRQE